VSHGFDLGRSARRLRGHCLSMTQENAPGCGELDIAAVPVKKPYAKFSLQVRDLLTQGRL
jgi:hypothetical protein